jgi:acetyl/propionyl-CoA carboxylase alpha subunit
LESAWPLDGHGPITYQVEIDGTPVTVELMPDGSLCLDGRVLHMDVSEIQGLSLYSLLLDDASYEVLVDESDGWYYALLQGKIHRIKVDDGTRPHWARSTGFAPAGEVAIRAPLCGLVVDVMVAAGQEVNADQVIAVLESMKMQNEIRCPRGGTVRELKTETGTVVREGDVLAIVD